MSGSTAGGPTTPHRTHPPGMAMAKSPPGLAAQNALMNMPNLNYVEMHNLHMPTTPAVTTGSLTLDRSLNLAPCKVQRFYD